MIFALIYLTISLIVYMAMFRFILRQSKGFKTQTTHPEMHQVKPNEPLLTVKFSDPSGPSRSEQHPDLGFAVFLANRDSRDRDNDDS